MNKDDDKVLAGAERLAMLWLARGFYTDRRMKAVELLISLGYSWDGNQWTNITPRKSSDGRC